MRVSVNLILAVLLCMALGCSSTAVVNEAAERTLTDAADSPLSSPPESILDIIERPESLEALEASDPVEPVEAAQVEADLPEPSTTLVTSDEEPDTGVVLTGQPWDAAIKAERRAVYNETKAAIHEVFLDDPFPLATENLPSPDLQAIHGTGDTAKVTLTIERLDAAQPPVVITGYANNDTGYSHVIADRLDIVELLAARFPSGPEPTNKERGRVETVSSSDYRSIWSRGVFGYEGSAPVLPLDDGRWYQTDLVRAQLRTEFAGFGVEALWRHIDQDIPTPTQDGQGNSVYVATLIPGDWIAVSASLGGNGDDDVVRAVEAVFSPQDQLERLTIDWFGDAVLKRSVLVVEDRGEPITVPDVSEVVRSPFEAPTRQPIDDYTWIATGTFKDSADAPVEGPWTADGRINKGYYGDSYLAMTAADVAILAGLQTISVDDDALVRRWGDGWVHSLGIFPELAPEWADRDRVDPLTLYSNHDPFQVPTNLFPSGLGEEQLWIWFRTVPEVTSREGWENHRVTTGVVNTDFWAYQQRIGSGLFAWVQVEDPNEVFAITIGADQTGRAQRIELRTTDPDGGGLVFDVRIDDEPRSKIAWTDVESESSGSIPVDRDWEPEGGAEQAVTSFDEYIAARRVEYPAFDHSRSPERLTLITTRVKDEPSGAYTPQGEYYSWTNGLEFVAQIDDGEGTKRGIACLELEDNEWRFNVNDLERLWRAYADGSSLDGVILRTNTNGWYSVDVYPSDGARHPADLCSEAQTG